MKQYLSLRHIWIFSVVMMSVCACNQSRERHKKAYSDLINRNISINDSLSFQIINDTINSENFYDFYIITIVDSAGCTPCKMHLNDWKLFLKEVIKNINIEVGFSMILETAESKDILQKLLTNGFMYPIVFDEKAFFRKTNSIPDDHVYQTILLNSQMDIIAIGNPATNPKIADLYLKIINEDSFDHGYIEYEPCRVIVDERCVLNNGEPITRSFSINEICDNLLTIQQVSNSCDCISVEISNDSLKSNGSIDIGITWNADTISGDFRHYTDVYFNEMTQPVRLIVHGYNK